MKYFKNILNKCLFVIILLLYKFKLKKKNDNYRILIYACCDEYYSHYIPIFLDSMLRADKMKKLDFEIGTSSNKLNENEEKAINFLQKKYNYSKILIKYNYFIKNSSLLFIII